MGLKRIVEPASLAVDFALSKKYCEIPESDTTHDDHITHAIKRATDVFEHRTRRSLINQQWRLSLEHFDERTPLPRPPAVSIQSIQYRDNTDTWQTWPESNYALIDECSPAEVYFKTLPSVGSLLPLSCRVNYTAGFGSSYTSIPTKFAGVIHELVVFFFHNRGDLNAPLPTQIAEGLNSFKCGAVLGYYEMIEDD